MSKLLINNSPLVVLPELAMLAGLSQAIILQQVHYNCQDTRYGEVLEDGFRYVYNTYDEWQKYAFPFWGVKAIQYNFLELEKAKYLISQQPLKKLGNMKKYYRVNTEKINIDIDLIRQKLLEEISTKEGITRNSAMGGHSLEIQRCIKETNMSLRKNIKKEKPFKTENQDIESSEVENIEQEENIEKVKKTKVPKNFEITKELRTWLKTKFEKEIPESELQNETDKFIEHYEASGERRASWRASWQTWIRNAVKWGNIDFNKKPPVKVIAPAQNQGERVYDEIPPPPVGARKIDARNIDGSKIDWTIYKWSDFIHLKVDWANNPPPVPKSKDDEEIAW